LKKNSDGFGPGAQEKWENAGFLLSMVLIGWQNGTRERKKRPGLPGGIFGEKKKKLMLSIFEEGGGGSLGFGHWKGWLHGRGFKRRSHAN